MKATPSVLSIILNSCAADPLPDAHAKIETDCRVQADPPAAECTTTATGSIGQLRPAPPTDSESRPERGIVINNGNTNTNTVPAVNESHNDNYIRGATSNRGDNPVFPRHVGVDSVGAPPGVRAGRQGGSGPPRGARDKASVPREAAERASVARESGVANKGSPEALRRRGPKG